MQFSDVIGHHSIKEQFRKSVNEGRISHAQLLLGPEGSGALPLALSFAQYLLCEDKNSDDACGKCNACRKAAKLIHPDIHFSFPVIKTKSEPPVSNDFIKEWRQAVLTNPYLAYNDWLDIMNAENKQGNITAKECQSIVRTLTMKTYESKYKVLIMWVAEMLKNEGNRLLKIIEEPPENTVIFLLAEDENQILNTIRSRTQITRLRPLPDDEIMQRLRDQFQLPEQQSEELAYLADGNFNKAIQLAVSTESGHAEAFRQWMLLLIKKGNLQELIQWVDQMSANGREKQKHFIQYGLHFLNEMLQASALPTYQPRVSEAYRKMISFLNDKMTIEQIAIFSQLLENIHYYIERNAHQKIQFLNVSLKMKQVLLNKEAVAAPEIIR